MKDTLKNIGIFGASGRIGSLLIQEIAKESDLRVSSVFARDEIQTLKAQNLPLASDIGAFLQNAQCVIDFSSNAGTYALLRKALDMQKYIPMVIGSTGLDSQTNALMKTASERFPIVYASNMSRGVAILNKISALVAAGLRESDIEIVEIHHHHKKDAPSGTALSLAQSCAKARGLDLAKVRISGRDGDIGARSKDEIGVMSLRGGDVAGRHTVGFYIDGEYLELTHNATSRLTFAKGAIAALKWLTAQKRDNALYGVDDFLSL